MTSLTNTRRANSDDVSQEHPLYVAHASQVRMVDNVYEGSDTTRQYLFSFPQELPETFLTRQKRATLRNFVKRAVEAFVGMIFRKPIEIDGYPARTKRSFERIDTKNNINEFTKQVTTALAKHSKAYILIDSPAKGSSTGYPYLVLVERPSLINWRKDEEGHFTMVVIEEIVAEPYGQFGTEYIKQWRHIDQFGTIRIYRSSRANNNTSTPAQKAQSNTAGYYIHQVIDTDYDGIPLIEVDIGDVPLLYDIAQMNIKHFNRQSHKDRYLTMAALPIPVIWGADIDDAGNPTTAKPALVIGVDEAFIFTGTKDESDFQWRELSGDSIDLLEKDLDSIVEDITTGILRAAETANSVQKTATEVALLQAEASNRVSSLAIAVNNAMRDALDILAKFNNETVPDTAIFKLSSDFNAALAGTDGQNSSILSLRSKR